MAGLVVFLVGDERRAFEKKTRYYVVFDDVQGLTRGAPVRMGGVDVGQVASVAYSENAADNRLRVTMDIVKSEAMPHPHGQRGHHQQQGSARRQDGRHPGRHPRPRTASPRIGHPQQPPQDFAAVADRLGAISEKAEAVMGNLQKTTDTLASTRGPGGPEDVASDRSSHILKSVDEGDGYVSPLS